MTTQTEALKLALEALEESKTNNDSMEFHDRKNKAITAIKEALAQPEQEPVAWCVINNGELIEATLYRDYAEEILAGQIEGCGSEIAPLYTTPPQPEPPPECQTEAEKTAFAFGWFKAMEAQRKPEQEPVADAWIHEDGRMTDAKAKTARKELFKGWRALGFLNTTPPQRKPLTDKQIGVILEDPNIAEKHQGNWLVLPYAYARAIEAAHGIKE